MGRRVEESVWDERRELVRRQASSGLSAARFCRENGVNLWNFHSWKRKLNGKDAERRTRSVQRPTPIERSSSAFLQVPIQAVPRSDFENSWIEVSAATGIVVRVPSGNVSALRTVLGVLGQEGSDD